MPFLLDSLHSPLTMATEETATNHPLKLVEDDVVKFLACQTHLGATTCDQQMKQYVWKRKADGQVRHQIWLVWYWVGCGAI